MSVPLIEIKGVGPAAVDALIDHGFKTVTSIANTTVEKLVVVSGFSSIRAQKTIDAAKQLLAISDPGTAVSVKKPVSQETVQKKPTPKDKKPKKSKKSKKSKDKKSKKGKNKKSKSKKK